MDFVKLIESAASTTGGLIEEAAGCLDSATPCTEWDVKGLGNHMTAFLAYSAAAATKNTPMPEGGEIPDFTAGDWSATYKNLADELVAAWSTPGSMEGETAFGPGMLPAQYAAGITLMELVVHGWDLAAATGQTVEFSPEVVAATKQIVEGAAADAPADLFHPPVSVGDDASEMDRMLALSGRVPTWSA